MLRFAVGADAREAFLPYRNEVRVGLALFGREARGRVLAAGRDEGGHRAPLVLGSASMASPVYVARRWRLLRRVGAARTISQSLFSDDAVAGAPQAWFQQNR